MKGLRRITKVCNRNVYLVDEPIPLLGHIAFGIIDRGANVLQVRPSTICFHSCIYCSVDAGPESKWRLSEFIVERKWLIRWIKEIVKFKNRKVEVLLDGVGEPLTHPEIIEIIRDIKNIENVRQIALETHGGSLGKTLLEKLSEAGLNRINLSLDTLDQEKAKILSGVNWYNVKRIIRLVEWAYENTSLDFILTPVLVPGYNEEDMEDIIEFAKKVGLGRKIEWPSAVLIQKFEVHKYGRKPPYVKAWTWKRFYKWLKELEEKTHYRLIIKDKEIGIEKAKSIPKPFRVGEKVSVIILESGWLKKEWLATDINYRRVITVVDTSFNELRPGKVVNVRIIRDKDNIFLARK